MGDFDSAETAGAAAERRLRQLEALYLGGPLAAHGQAFSVESLIDVLLVLYDECCNSSLRKEKTVSDFLECGRHRSPEPFFPTELDNSVRTNCS